VFHGEAVGSISDECMDCESAFETRADGGVWLVIVYNKLVDDEISSKVRCSDSVDTGAERLKVNVECSEIEVR
jgi:hypothetical protein